MLRAKNPQLLLRRALLADGIAGGAMGLLMTLAADPLAERLGLPTILLLLAGLSLLPFAALLLYLARRPSVPRRLAWGIVAYNLLWVAESVLLLLGGWVEPTTLGYVFVAGQALAVLCLAELQVFGLRRAA